MRYVLNIQRFKFLLREQGYTSIAQFSEAAGIHRNTLRRYFSGEASVFATSYDRICKVLGSDQLELLLDDSDFELSRVRPFLMEAVEKYPRIAFFLFGSRAKGTSRKFSDWDIGVSGGGTKLQHKEHSDIVSSIEDAAEDFPYVIQVVNFDDAPAWFAEQIDYEPVFICGNQDTFHYLRGTLHGIKNRAA